MSSELQKLEAQIEAGLESSFGFGEQLLKIANLSKFKTDRTSFNSYLKSKLGLDLKDAELLMAIAQEAKLGKKTLFYQSRSALFEIMIKMAEKETVKLPNA